MNVSDEFKIGCQAVWESLADTISESKAASSTAETSRDKAIQKDQDFKGSEGPSVSSLNEAYPLLATDIVIHQAQQDMLTNEYRAALSDSMEETIASRRVGLAFSKLADFQSRFITLVTGRD